MARFGRRAAPATTIGPGSAVSVTDPRHPAHGNLAVVDSIDPNGDAWVWWRDAADRKQWTRVPTHHLRRFGATRRRAGVRDDLRADEDVGSSRVDLQACKLEYSIVSPK